MLNISLNRPRTVQKLKKENCWLGEQTKNERIEIECNFQTRKVRSPCFWFSDTNWALMFACACKFLR